MHFEFKLTITNGIIEEYLVHELMAMGIDDSHFQQRKGYSEFHHTINNISISLGMGDLDFLSCIGTLTWEEGFMLTLDCK